MDANETEVDERDISSTFSGNNSSSTGGKKEYYNGDSSILLVGLHASNRFKETLQVREDTSSPCIEFIDTKNNTVASIVVRDTIRIRSMDKMCRSMTIMCLPIDKLSVGVKPWKTLAKGLLKNNYDSFYYDHFQNIDNYYKDKFTCPAFDRLTSFLGDPRQRLVLPFSPTILKVMFSTGNIIEFNISLIREQEVVTRKIKESKNILFSVTNSTSCKALLEEYEFELIPYKNAQLTKDDILSKFAAAKSELKNAVRDFLVPILHIDQVVFLELRKKGRR